MLRGRIPLRQSWSNNAAPTRRTATVYRIAGKASPNSYSSVSKSGSKASIELTLPVETAGPALRPWCRRSGTVRKERQQSLLAEKNPQGVLF